MAFIILEAVSIIFKIKQYGYICKLRIILQYDPDILLFLLLLASRINLFLSILVLVLSKQSFRHFW
jgi:hypothetical protein